MPFAALGLSPALVRFVGDRHYTVPTAIQTEAIPAILRGEDVWASAQTGSGKTAAFVLPLLQQLLGRRPSTPRRVYALILVPTRELAVQLGTLLADFAEYLPQPVKTSTVYGGVSINPQMMWLRGGADLVVATPGRLLDLIEHKALSLSTLEVLVLDEADRLLDLGFADELTRILALLPPQRQTLFFSATFDREVQALAQSLLRKPTRIDVQPTPVTRPDIAQRAIHVDAAQRTPLLRYLIAEQGWARVLVFVATQYATEHVADKLRRAGLQAAAFHGELSQGARTEVLEDFKAQRLQVLVATDMAARGIDIEQLPAVVNYDLPRAAVEYTHRIGRTGRAGASGVALSFISADTEAHFRLIEKRQQQRVPRERVPGFEPSAVAQAAGAPASPAPNHGGIKGKRKSKKDKLREAAARQANKAAGR